jgi:ADP-ribose pyrophosphatase
MIKKWPKVASKIIGDYRVFKLRQDTSQSPVTGGKHDFYVLESADWINVIPITPEGMVVMIRQYRHGTETVTLEVPGGMVDEQDGSPEESAARELLEETGYAADKITRIGTVTPNPAILNNRCYTLLAQDAHPVAPPSFDGSEDIEVALVSLPTVHKMIASSQITHALTIAAFYFYEQFGNK